MEYIDKQFPLEYVENDWDNFLNEKSNGERVRYFKFYRLIHYDNTTEGCINDFKKLQVLSKELVKGVVDINYGRTFFNISYKVVDGFKLMGILILIMKTMLKDTIQTLILIVNLFALI